MQDGFLLLRHGALPKELTHHMIGAKDVNMSCEGLRQVRTLAKEWLPTVYGSLAAVVTSPLGRCQETVRLLFGDSPWLPIHVEPDLSEISLGAWAGKSKREIMRNWPNEYALRGLAMDSFVPPEGESLRMLLRRSLHALMRVKKIYPHGIVLVVTHAGVMRVLLAHVLALPLAEAMRIPLTYACHCFCPFSSLEVVS